MLCSYALFKNTCTTTGKSRGGRENYRSPLHMLKQVGQLSQTNRAAAWVSFGKNVSEKSVHLTSLCYISKC